MKIFIAIFLTGLLTQNYVLSKFLGICPFLGVSKKTNTAMGMSLAVIFVMVLATAVTYPINTFLVAHDLSYLQTIVFILVIAALVQFVEIALKKFMPSLYNSLGIYLPLITTNCCVLGVVLLNVGEISILGDSIFYNYPQALFNSFSAGLGFMLAMFLFSGVREKLETADIPKSLRGLPITLVAASLVSLSFMGFTGIVDGFCTVL